MNGFTDLADNLFDGHHPEETFAFSHSSINETGTDIGDDDVATSLESLLAQGFRVVDLVGFRCAVGGSHRLATQSASRRDGYEVTMALQHMNSRGGGTWGIAAVIPKYLSLRLPVPATTTTTKSTLKKQFPIKKFARCNKKHYLCTHENPPSLFTMLKSAGRFIFIR